MFVQDKYYHGPCLGCICRLLDTESSRERGTEAALRANVQWYIHAHMGTPYRLNYTSEQFLL